MINLYTGNNYIYLTLRENCLLSSPHYRFKFVHRTTNQEVVIVKQNSEDLSAHPSRYNKFLLTGAALGKTGQWKYFVYEQPTTSPTDAAARLIETGMLTYHEAGVSYTTHDKNNTYVTR